ncbi:MAG: hypothetical protein ACXWI5_04805 [Croceibacterium sp.]
MSRTVENVTLAYKRTPDDDDHLHIAVGNCDGSSPWEMDESLNGVSAKSLRDAVAEEIDNAKLNCKLAEGVEDRLMAGLDEAFARVKPFAAPHVATVGGWKLSDEGSLPGDDGERVVSMTKALSTVTMTYQPNGSGDGASIQLQCEGASYGGGFDFGNPPEDHVKVVNKEMTDDYADFVKDCKGKPETLAVVMQDFPEAQKTLEQWLVAKPFVYPPDTSSKK